MSDLSSMIQAHLTEKGRPAQAAAFSRWAVQPMKIELNTLTVREAKANLSGLLEKVLTEGPTTIMRHRRPADAVVMIGLDELAEMISEMVDGFEKTPAAKGRDPMAMFAAVDRLPKVEEADALIVNGEPVYRDLDLG